MGLVYNFADNSLIYQFTWMYMVVTFTTALSLCASCIPVWGLPLLCANEQKVRGDQTFAEGSLDRHAHTNKYNMYSIFV